MNVYGHNLFPLEKILPATGEGYFMAANGNIFSSRARKGQLTALLGSSTSSGRYFSINGTLHRHDTLVKLAQAHPSFKVETADTITADTIGYTKPAPTSSADERAHAPSLVSGIKMHGVIIATVENDKLVFGTNPVIHVSEKSWKNEIERLARLKSGTTFIALQIVASVTAGALRWE